MRDSKSKPERTEVAEVTETSVPRFSRFASGVRIHYTAEAQRHGVSEEGMRDSKSKPERTEAAEITGVSVPRFSGFASGVRIHYTAEAQRHGVSEEGMRDSKSKPERTEMAEITEASVPRFSGLNRLTELIIGAAIEVHRNTGPGLMESVYEECLCYELDQLGLKFERQVEPPVGYKGIKLKCGFRMDMVVEDAVVLELKTVDQLLAIHSAQLLTYLKLSGKKLGLLINFNERVLKNGLKRLANRTLEASERLPSVLSATSVLSDFDFLSPCLCASVVNK